MSKVKIISDSSCDLPSEILKKYDIEIIPFYINLGGQIYRDDGVSVTAESIYRFVEAQNTLPGTIAVSVEDFKEEFQKWHDQGYEIICHSISSEMSCSCQNARIAAEEVGDVYVVDSRNLSSGVGHLVLESAILAQEGRSAAEIYQDIKDLTPKISASFILDNLEYMRKGGRCSSVMLLGANLLKIKPEIVVDNGVMKVGHKFRGTLERVLTDYIDSRLTDSEKIRADRIFIAHTGCSREILEMVKKRIESHLHFSEIIEARAGSTVTSHSGPNTLGIIYIYK